MKRWLDRLRLTLGIGLYKCPFDLPADMHVRESYTVLFFYRDTRYVGLREEISEWFRRNNIVVKLTRFSRWAPTPVFATKADLDAFIELELVMRRRYEVADRPAMEEWLKEHDILHLWEWKPDYRGGGGGSFRLLSDRDAVHLSLCWNVRSRKEVQEERDRKLGWPNTFSDGYFKDRYVVTPDA